MLTRYHRDPRATALLLVLLPTALLAGLLGRSVGWPAAGALVAGIAGVAFWRFRRVRSAR